MTSEHFPFLSCTIPNGLSLVEPPPPAAEFCELLADPYELAAGVGFVPPPTTELELELGLPLLLELLLALELPAVLLLPLVLVLPLESRPPLELELLLVPPGLLAALLAELLDPMWH